MATPAAPTASRAPNSAAPRAEVTLLILARMRNGVGQSGFHALKLHHTRTDQARQPRRNGGCRIGIQPKQAMNPGSEFCFGRGRAQRQKFLGGSGDFAWRYGSSAA